MKSVLCGHGFTQSTSDPCLLHMDNVNGIRIFLLFYVDDIVVATESKVDCGAVMKKLLENFELSSMSDTHFFLSLEIQRDRETNTI